MPILAGSAVGLCNQVSTFVDVLSEVASYNDMIFIVLVLGYYVRLI